MCVGGTTCYLQAWEGGSLQKFLSFNIFFTSPATSINNDQSIDPLYILFFDKQDLINDSTILQ